MAEDSAPRDHRTGRRMFVHNANSVVTVTDGYMKAIDAQEVLLECLAAWGVSGHDENTIEPYVACIAQMLRQGTSAERDFTAVMFEIRGSWCSLESLRYAAMKRDSSENPVRVWARSYREGEIAVRIRDMLSDPNNVALRQEAALDYQCALDIVHVSFDFADALVKYPEIVLTQTERFAIRANTVAKVRSSRSNVLGGSDGGSMQDAAANAAAVSSAAPIAPSGGAVQAGGARVRASFAPMR